MKIDYRRNRRPHAVEVLLRLGSPRIQKRGGSRVMRDSILKRIPPGTVIMKQMANDPDCLKLVIFKEIKNFFLRMEHFVPGVYSEWENEKDITIYVQNGHDFSGVEKSLLKPVKIASRSELTAGARNWLNECNAVANCVETNRKVNELRNSVLSVASAIYDDTDIKAYLYGSRFTGLAREDADVDIFIEMDNSFNGSYSSLVDYQSGLVESLARGLRSRPYEYEKVFALTNTTVPVLRFQHKKTNLSGEIAFRSGMSRKNSELVKLLLDLDQRVKFVVCGVKFWFAQNNLDERINFPPVAQTWLAFYFLMQDDIGLIPSVKMLQSMMAGQQIRKIENWNCAVPDITVVRSRWTTSCYSSGEELLEKFFVFYSNVPVEKHVLCTFDATMRLRRQFFVKYQQLKADEELHKRVHDDFSGFCIQDPFDRFKNLTKNQKRTNTRKSVEFAEWANETAELLKYEKIYKFM